MPLRPALPTTNYDGRVVGRQRRLAIPRRSPRFAWGPSPGGSRRYSQFPVDPHALRGAPRREARAATRNSPSIPTLCVGPLAGRLAPLLAIPRRSPRFAWGPSPGGSRRYSQFPVDPHALRGAPRREARAATRNSPSIPTLCVGPLAGRLAPLLAIPRRSPRFAWGPAPGGSRRYSQFPVDPHALRGAPRREARAATRNSPSIPTLCVGPLAG